MSTKRALQAIAEAAISALAPETLVADALVRDGRAVTVVAIGKAARPMMRGAERALGDSIVSAVCAGPDWGAHPVPSAGSLEAGEALLAAAEAARAGERFVALISGGGSSLAIGLAGTLTLEDKRATSRVLLASGASIDEINVVRKHISSIKGGRLGLAAGPAELETLVLSDVVSGDLGVVSSGPTLADASTYARAAAIAERLELPAAVRAHLASGVAGEHAETPAELHGTVRLLADNRALVSRAVLHARQRGIDARPIDEPLIGDPGAIVKRIEARAGEAGVLIVAGGEATPVIPEESGRGGRAQHLALLLARVVFGHGGAGALVIGSDGVDGPSDGAGGFVGADSIARLAAAGVDVEKAIERFDSATALAAIGDQLPAQPTGSNLADLVLVWTGGRELG